MPREGARRPWMQRAAGGLTVLLLAGAGCSDAGPAHTFEVIEESGVTVAVSSDVPKHEGELFAYEKVLEIRSDPDDPQSLLYQPTSFTLGDDGLYYVADSGNHRIAVFDPEGRLVRTIGSEGDGPGELRFPHSVEVRDGVVTVTGSKTSRFTTDGVFLDQVTGPRQHRAPDGRFVTFRMTQDVREDGYQYVGIRAEILDQDLDPVAAVESEQVRFARILDRTRKRLQYGAMPSAPLLPSGEILMSVGSEPVVSWYGLDGQLLRRARIDRAPESLTDRDRARVEEQYDRLIAAARELHGEAVAESLKADKGSLQFADPKAYWQDLMADGSGWLWLRRPTPDVPGVRDVPQMPEPQTFMILDPRGEYIGDTTWPPEAGRRGSRIVRGHLLTMNPDPETEETVPTVYRIRPIPESLDYPGHP